MVKHRNLVLKGLVLIWISTFSIISYSQSSSPIIGNWVFQMEPSVENMVMDIKSDLATSTDLQNHLASYYNGRQLFFGTNGAFSISLVTGQQLNGQWQIIGNTLKITEANGTITEYGLGALSNSSLLLLAPSDISTENRQLFPKLYFSKIQ